MKRALILLSVAVLVGAAVSCSPPPGKKTWTYTPGPNGVCMEEPLPPAGAGPHDWYWTGEPPSPYYNMFAHVSTDGTCTGEINGISLAFLAPDFDAANALCGGLSPGLVRNLADAGWPAPPDLWSCF